MHGVIFLNPIRVVFADTKRNAVRPQPAMYGVITATTIDDIPPAPVEEYIAAIATFDAIVPAAAVNRVIPIPSVDSVFACA
jgi:hypothetical protein